MKTIDEAAKEHGVKMWKEESRPSTHRDFKSGVEFAQRWIPVEEELPITFESGNWDGLRSDFIIAKDSLGEWYKARTYSGFLDGHNFYDWYSESDYMLSNIVSWRPIELK